MKIYVSACLKEKVFVTDYLKMHEILTKVEISLSFKQMYCHMLIIKSSFCDSK